LCDAGSELMNTRVYFIVSLFTVALSHRKRASAEISSDTTVVRETTKRTSVLLMWNMASNLQLPFTPVLHGTY
jgi:hypothetical protein